MFIRAKLFEVPEAYPKGTEGWLVNDKRFIRELEEFLVKHIHNACTRNTNPRAKPKASDTKSGLISKCVFGALQSLVALALPKVAHGVAPMHGASYDFATTADMGDLSYGFSLHSNQGMS